MKTWIPDNACADAVKWVGRKSLTVVWRTCQRADWMLWLVVRVCEQRVAVLCACECARTALRYVPKGEDRPRLAIGAAERWAADPTEINGAAAAGAAGAAGDGTWDAAGAAGYTWAAAAARAAGYAAGAAGYTWAAAAAGAAGAAARAAGAAAGDAARAKAHKTMCGLMRRRLIVRAGKLVERKPKGKGGKG